MKKRHIYLLICLLLLCILTLGMNLFTGSSGISPREAVSALAGKLSGSAAEGIMMKIRLPRALSALILGGALSLSGYLLQTFFRNPIAGPFVLGVSSGAKLIVALTMIAAAGAGYPITSLSMICAAFAGSLLSLGTVLAVSPKVKSMSTLVVCGVMIGYICSAVTEIVVTFAQDSDIVNLHNWSMGTFSGMTMDNVHTMAAVTAAAAAGAFLLSKPIGAYRMGEEYARSAGVRVKLLRAGLILLSGLLSACVTAFAGPVSFVGVAAPHIIRRIFRTSKPLVLIPACFLGGSVFCMICDMIARTAFAPSELSISSVTAVFGAPVVIIMMIRGRRGELR